MVRCVGNRMRRIAAAAYKYSLRTWNIRPVGARTRAGRVRTARSGWATMRTTDAAGVTRSWNRVKRGHMLANGALLTLMLGHFTNDMFGGVLPVLYPEAKERFGVGNAEIGLVTLAYTGASSLSQPLFGYLTDRHGRRWFAPVVLLWGACWVSLYGFAGSFGVFVALAALAGLASGAYHPFGASNAAAVTAERDRNTGL